MFKRKISDQSFQDSLKFPLPASSQANELGASAFKFDPETGEIFNMSPNSIFLDPSHTKSSTPKVQIAPMTPPHPADSEFPIRLKKQAPLLVSQIAQIAMTLAMGFWISEQIEQSQLGHQAPTKLLASIATTQATLVDSIEEIRADLTDINNQSEAFFASHPVVEKSPPKIHGSKPTVKPTLKNIRYLGQVKQGGLDHVVLELPNQLTQLVRVGDRVIDQWHLAAIHEHSVLLTHQKGHQMVLTHDLSKH